jgi:hypothetical protein
VFWVVILRLGGKPIMPDGQFWLIPEEPSLP